MFETWDNVCRLIYRPARSFYDDSDLGPVYFAVENQAYERVDFDVINPRGLTIKCSHFRPPTPATGYPNSVESTENLPCVIYCHGNCGNRLDSFEAVEMLMPLGITVVGFDFAGCGLSDGETISLGHFEQHDIGAIVQYMRANRMASSIGLWGRSMGAVSSIMYASSDPTIAGLVLDSPFSDLQELMREVVASYNYNLPWFIFSPLIQTVRSSIRRKADFDILSLQICPYASKCFSPALIGHASEDTFVQPHHSKKIHDAYQGEKNYVTFPGGHNSPRPDFFSLSVSIFFTNTLLRQTEWIERPIAGKDDAVHNVPHLPQAPIHPGTPISLARPPQVHHHSEAESSQGVSTPTRGTLEFIRANASPKSQYAVADDFSNIKTNPDEPGAGASGSNTAGSSKEPVILRSPPKRASSYAQNTGDDAEDIKRDD